MKNVFRKGEISLQNRLIILFFILFFLLSSIITCFSLVAMRTEMVREVGQSRAEILKQVGERMRIVLGNMQTISNLYYNDIRIRQIVYDSKVLSYDDIQYLYALDIKYASTFKTVGLDYYAAIISKNGAGYYSQTSGANPQLFILNDPRYTSWYEKVQEAQGQIVWISSFNIADDGREPQYVCSASRAFIDPETSQYCGMIMVNVDERQLYDMYTDLLTRNNNVYILDNQGYVVTHPDQSQLGRDFSKKSEVQFQVGENYKLEDGMLISRYEDPYTNWTIVEEIPISSVFTSIYRVEFWVILIFCFSLLSAFLVIIVFAKKTVKPLNVLCENIERVSYGNLMPISQKYGWKEIRKINGVFNHMISMLLKLLDDIKQHEKQKRKSDIEYLQAQINPHFIYNTLFSIKCMVAMEKNQQAEIMLEEFIRLLKNKLDIQKEYVTVQEEIDGIIGYLNIQKMRYPASFDESILVDPTACSCKIPRMILQPLVENAIFHGIEPCHQNCRLMICVKRRTDRLIVEIFDNGVGISQDRIHRIWNEKQTTANSHIGIMNVHQRIQLYFGDQYGLTIYSKEHVFTKVVLTLPVLH